MEECSIGLLIAPGANKYGRHTLQEKYSGQKHSSCNYCNQTAVASLKRGSFRLESAAALTQSHNLIFELA